MTQNVLKRFVEKSVKGLKNQAKCQFPKKKKQWKRHVSLCIVFIAFIRQQMLAVMQFRAVLGSSDPVKCAVEWMTDSNPGAPSGCAIKPLQHLQMSLRTSTTGVTRVNQYTSDSYRDYSECPSNIFSCVWVRYICFVFFNNG